MAADIVPNGIKIEWNATQNGVPVVNRVYVTKTTAPTSGDLDDAIVAALAFFNDMKAAYDPSYVLQNITATDVHVANGTQTILPLTTGNVGTGVGGPAAANAAAVISLRTAQIGRSFRGRFYVGGLIRTNLATAQTIDNATTTFYATTFQDFIDALAALNMTLVVVSRFAAGVARVVNLATEIISIIVDNKVDSQRRRTAN